MISAFDTEIGYAHEIVPEWAADPDFVVFGALASETDRLPFGSVRQRWSPAALAKADLEIAKITDAWKARVERASMSVIERFSSGRRFVTLYRPVGPEELRLIEASGWRAFPPRLPGQPIFYPVTNEKYPTQIARDWNVKESGAGFVTAFEVDGDYLSQYSKQQVGGAIHTEYWIPAEVLDAFNANIAGQIRVLVFALVSCSRNVP